MSFAATDAGLRHHRGTMRILVMGDGGDAAAPVLAALGEARCEVSHMADRPYDAVLLFAGATPPPMMLGPVMIDPVDRRVTRDDRLIRLSPREYALLMAIVEGRGRPVGRIALLDRVWGYRFDPGTTVVEVAMSRLRRKLGAGLIESVAGGYRITPA